MPGALSAFWPFTFNVSLVMTWRSQPTAGRYLLPLIPVLSLLLTAWLWGHFTARVLLVQYDGGVFLLGVALFLSLVLAGMGIYLAWCAFSMAYSLEPGFLLMRCGFKHLQIPYSLITEVHGAGDAIDDKSVIVRWQGASALLPGYIVGEGRSAQLGRVFSIANLPAAQQVFVVTHGMAYGLSPRNQSEFVRQLNTRLASKDAPKDVPVDTVPPLASPSRLAAWGAGLWSDRAVRTLFLVGLGINLLIWAYLALAYADLPVRVALHWNSQAVVDRIGDPTELLSLPLFALGVWLFNSIVARWALLRERAATLFLLAGAIAAQVIFFAGVLSIVLKNR